MSCDFWPITTNTRWTLPFVLVMATAPSVAHAQSSDCHPIRRGESATQLARRITGDSRNMNQPWFQILDLASRSVPKSQYDRIQPGWRACIVRETVESSVPLDARRDTIEARDLPGEVTVGTAQPMAAGVIRAIRAVDVIWVWLGAAAVLPLFAWRILDDYVARRKTVLIVMKHFAHRFVREFERPLMQQPAEHPVRSRLRLRPVRARLEILLAPGQGRRYPNLSDHRKNVEYDVVRVLRLLADDSFVRDPLYTQAGWVVVPFRFETGRKRRGVPCISFF